MLKPITRFKHLVISNTLVFQPFRKTLCEWHHQSCWYVISYILCKKTRCYPQQRLGNNASKENLRARIFPILGEVNWCFEIFAVTTSELQGVTATCFTNVVRKLNFPKPFQNLKQNLPNWPDTAQNIFHNPEDCTFQYWCYCYCYWFTKGTVPAPYPPVRNKIVFNTFWNLAWIFAGTHLEPPWNLAQNLPEPCRGTLAQNFLASLKPCPEPAPEPSRNPLPEPARNLPRNLPGTHGSEAAPAPPRNLYWLRPHS